MPNVVTTVYRYRCTKCGQVVVGNMERNTKAEMRCRSTLGKPRGKFCGGKLKFVSKEPVTSKNQAPAVAVRPQKKQDKKD